MARSSSSTDWRVVLDDEGERKVFEELEKPEWDWRTTSGISTATGMSAVDIERALESHPTLVKRSGVPSESGEQLYTLRSRFYERKSPIGKIWTVMSSSSGSSEG